MIEFFSFFLGLTSGVHTVEMIVIEPVVEVELRLDGRSLGTLYGEPWDIDCDLGEALAPHRLIAIGRDTERREIERINMWINRVASGEETPEDRSPVAVKLEPGTELPAAGEMDSWFLASGEPAVVAAVEPQPAEVVIVRDPGAQLEIDAIADSYYDRAYAFLSPTFKGAPDNLTERPAEWIGLELDVASP